MKIKVIKIDVVKQNINTLMELTSGKPDQPHEPGIWAVGDLYQFPIGLVLCIGANPTFAYFINAEGMPLADVQAVDIPRDAYFLHNTGLRYQYENREQVLRDYEAGLFTAYFDIP